MGRKSDEANNTNQLMATAGNLVTYGNNANMIQSGTLAPSPLSIINASATAFKKEGDSYKPVKQYAYKTSLTDIEDNTDLRDAGLYETYTPFDYQTPGPGSDGTHVAAAHSG